MCIFYFYDFFTDSQCVPQEMTDINKYVKVCSGKGCNCSIAPINSVRESLQCCMHRQLKWGIQVVTIVTHYKHEITVYRGYNGVCTYWLIKIIIVHCFCRFIYTLY